MPGGETIEIMTSFWKFRFGAIALMLATFAGERECAAGADRDILIEAYGAHIERIDRDIVVMKSGARIAFDDGRPSKPYAAWLASPDLKDMFRFAYKVQTEPVAPAVDEDPGRARPAQFFDAIYGDCTTGAAQRSLVDVPWLQRDGGGTIKVTRINGVADRLAAISAELENLPREMLRFLVPAAGGFNCRAIAGSAQKSPHGWGIAVDIAIAGAHHWQWAKPENGRHVWRSAIPMDIVRIFEKHGFIWGGRWYHYDTMHFEYRPELLPPAVTRP
jgi:D-alanyl-D-alanine carboxypeptidase